MVGEVGERVKRPCWSGDIREQTDRQRRGKKRKRERNSKERIRGKETEEVKRVSCAWPHS